MDLMDIRQWIFERKEAFIIAGSIIVFLFCVIIGISLRPEREKRVENPEVVYLKKKVTKPEKTSSSNSSKSQPSDNNEEAATANSSKGYYTKISPEEILQKIQEYGEIEAIPDDYQINHLPVGWALYFFELGERKDQFVQVTFDTLETGFGATVVSEVDLSLYPQFLEMEGGKKIWVAGIIEGVNPDGTGTFFIKPEHFGFDGEPPIQKSTDET